MTIKCSLKSCDNKNIITLNNAEKAEVQEGRYILQISNIPKDTKVKLLINNELIDENITNNFAYVLDFINNIGFMKIELYNSMNLLFFKNEINTTTYKVSKELLLNMLNFISENCLWHKNQFIYYDKSLISHMIRNPLYTYNWIKSHIISIESLVYKINSSVNKDINIYNIRTFANNSK